MMNDKEKMIDDYLKAASRACKLDSWTALATPINCPGDLLPALTSGRAELISAIPPRDLKAEEVKTLLDIIAALIDTNIALRTHSEQVAKMTNIWASSFSQLRSLGYRIEKFAHFHHSEAEMEDGD
jgi:hypothetical protein